MSAPADALSPRQRACLKLVWDRQATSKEIAAELGIGKATVDGYIAEAVETLGARDRRDAAAIAFGGLPRALTLSEVPPAVSGGDSARVAIGTPIGSEGGRSTAASIFPPPWRTKEHPRNSLFLGQTLVWIAIIAIGSLAALALATSVGNGLPSVARPVIDAVRRLPL